MPEANSPRGTYLVIAQRLRQEIQSGNLSEKLPSEATLVHEYGVARNTVRRALKALEKEGIISSAPGAGWRVTDGPIASLSERLAALITEDGLTVGDPFPSEAKLCERFDVSRTAVRRAVAQLEGMGLLDTVHGKGRTVRALPASLSQP